MKRDQPACPCDRCAQFIEVAIHNRDAALAMLKEFAEKDEALRSQLRTCLIKFEQLDPYPHLTNWDTIESERSRFDILFGINSHGARPVISAHQAWHDGFNDAKRLMMRELEK
jgi:Fe-S oxidoreductase